LKDLNLVPIFSDQNMSDLETLTFYPYPKNKKNIQVMRPYHWNDRKKLLRDYHYIFQLYEKYLIEITDSLNLIHGIHHPVDYWRIIIGPWLHYFISITLDRFETVRIAAENHNIKFTELPNYKIEDWVPSSYVEFNHQYYSDEWNSYLFSEIIKYTNLVNSSKSSLEIKPKIYKSKKIKGYLIKSLLFFLTRITRNFPKKVHMIEVDIPQANLYRLLFKLKSFSLSYYQRVVPKKHPIDINIRKDMFRSKEAINEFEKLLDILIPLNMPTCHIEGFKIIEKQAENIFPQKVDLVITSNAYFSNEHFKVWIANQKQNLTKLWVMVHGGHHGTALFNGPGKLTEDIADRFYAWGWGNYNLPSPKLSSLNKTNLSQIGNNILFIPYNISQYSNHLDSSPIAASFEDCLIMHKKFFNCLKEINLEKKLVIRLKSGIVPRDLKKEYTELSGLNNFVYSDEESSLESISKSELVVVTYDSTFFLEALTLNKPTCLFIRKDFWEMSEHSEPYFKKFLECGILHYDEKSLARHISNVQHDYSSWWESDLVQLSVESFLIKYGLSKEHWEEDWYNEINSYLEKLSK
tara:strand:+ start:13171 stop:14901 length:1731 start_codon:yes stop_codon:yes gene_type:complete